VEAQRDASLVEPIGDNLSSITRESWERYFPFKAPREEQVEAINFILRSFLEEGKRFVIADLGTGVGKSAIAVTVARYLNDHDAPAAPADPSQKPEVAPGAWFLTTQKILQEQYLDDFGGSRGCMKSIRSSTNYSCGFYKKISCSEGQQMLRAADKSSKFFKSCIANCNYKNEKKAFLEAPESVTNFSYALTESAGGSGKIGKRNLLVIDECLRGDTQIWIDTDREVSIKSIFENPEITHVMSYNESTDSYEPKRIMRRIRTEYDSSTRWIEIAVEIDGITKKIVTTDNHKIWTQNRGYVRADELTVEDIIKFDALAKNKVGQKFSSARKIKNQERKMILYTCSNCNKVFDKNSFTKHIRTHEIRSCQTCLAEFETSKLSTKKYCCHGCFSRSDQISILRSKRMSDANPSKNPDAVKKSVASWKKNWSLLDDKERTRRLKIFKNAPLHQNRALPNRLEQTIIDMKIDGLKFVGLGDMWLKFLNGKNKNPDFVVDGTNKVVEVGNAQFWHPEKERLDVIEKYKEIGFDCLYLTDEEVYSDPVAAKLRINKHINNHNVKISSVRLVERAKNKPKKTRYKYNIEVEDNHNYFANSFLVSNCHNADPELSRFIELAITDRTASALGIEWPDVTTHAQAVKWIKETYLLNAQRVVLEMERDVQDFKGLEGHEKEYADLLKKCTALKSHVDKVIKFLQVQNADNWVFEILPAVGGSGAKITFKPIDVSPFAEDTLFRLGKRVLLMSATVIRPDIFAQSLGIPEEQRACLTIPTPFPVENRPIMPFPIGSMSSDNIETTLPKMAQAVKEILKEHKGDKGIVHCHSFRVANYLRKHVKDKRLIFHDSHDREEALKKHLTSKEPTVLVSPSMAEGVDLRDDLARFQILMKVPYPSLGDKLVRKRMHRWSWWYPMQTVKTIVQAVGRAIRSETDHAATYILDADWRRFYGQHKELFPDAFRAALKEG
jgi:Rad3-related DNA helicase